MPQFRLAGIVPESITDGPGIRATIFVQGCPHGCPGCHNPETHDFNGGRLADTQEIFVSLCANPLLSGITLSGGEPFCQAEAMTDLAFRGKQAGLEVAVYTGFTFEELWAQQDPARLDLLRQADVLVDGPFVLARRSLELKFRGSDNQRILDLKKSLEAGEPILMEDGRWN